MRFPCESVVKTFITTYRHRMIKTLKEFGWTQQKIANKLSLTQAGVSNYLNKEEDLDNVKSFNIDALVEETINLINQPGNHLDVIMEIVCKQCKQYRFPSEILCEMHKDEIPELKALECEICSKYIDKEKFSYEGEKNKIIRELIEGFNKIRYNKKFTSLIPQVQSNLVLGFKDPKKNTYKDYAAFPGRIVKVNDEARVTSVPEFGSSKYIASLISIVRSRFPSIRCATCIKYDARIKESLEMSSFNMLLMENERKLDLVKKKLENNVMQKPDIIVFTGSIGLEPVTYILGDSLDDVLVKLEKIASWI
ncbi:MAG: thiamine-phosphate synthase family protein [Promethearchaeota archaeon]